METMRKFYNKELWIILLLRNFNFLKKNAPCKHTPSAISHIIWKSWFYDDCETNSYLVFQSGYMVPENEMREQFSVKSDIFSFGVFAIEIVSGRKWADFTQSEDAPDLLHRVSNFISISITNFLIQIHNSLEIYSQMGCNYMFLFLNCADMEAMDGRKSSRANGSNFSRIMFNKRSVAVYSCCIAMCSRESSWQTSHVCH